MTGLVGMTIPQSALNTGATPPNYDAGKTQDQADNIFIGFVGRSIAGGHLAVTKKFWNLSDWSTGKNNISNYGSYGTTVLFALKPLFTAGLPLGSDFTTSGTTAQKNAAIAEKLNLASFLASMAGFGFTASTALVTLWQEPANSQNMTHTGAVDYNNMLRTYAPVMAAAHGGVTFPLVSNVNFDGNVSNATNFANAALGLRAYSGAGASGLPTISAIYLDFYTNNYYGHNLRPDTSVDSNGDSIAGIADAAGLPFGFAEFGCVPKQDDPAGPPYPKSIAYMQYILSFMRGRLNAGKPNGHTIYYDGVGLPTGTPGDITSPIGQDPFVTPTGASEFRVALWQNIYDGLAATTPSFTQRQKSQNFSASSGVLSLWNNQVSPPSGGAATLNGSLLIAKFELGDCQNTTTVTGPAGWIQVPHEGKAGTATGQARAQIWYLPNCQTGLYGDASHLATFTCSNTAATFKGVLQEWTTPAATLQALDQSGGAGAVASATSLPVSATAANSFTGDLAVAMFGAVLSGGTTGQGFTPPAGWTGDGNANNLTQVFHSVTETAPAGTTSLTDTVTLGTWTMASWAGTVATFFSQAAITLANTTGALPGGTQSVAYSAALSAAGGAAPYTFALASGTLPTGVTLSGGVLSGTPSVPGTYSFHITCTDCSQQSVNTAFSIIIAPAGATPLVLTPETPPGGTAGTFYTATFAATGGTPPYVWTVT